MAAAAQAQPATMAAPAASAASAVRPPVILEADRVSGRPDIDAQAEGNAVLQQFHEALLADPTDHAEERRARMDAAALAPDERKAIYAQTREALAVYFDADPAAWFVEKYFRQLDGWRAANGLLPSDLLLGEFGALRTDSRYRGGAPQDRARYIADVRRTAEGLGIPWAFWNLYDGFGLTAEGTRAFDPAILAALGKDRN